MPIFRPFDSTSQLKCDDDDAALLGIRFARPCDESSWFLHSKRLGAQVRRHARAVVAGVLAIHLVVLISSLPPRLGEANTTTRAQNRVRHGPSHLPSPRVCRIVIPPCFVRVCVCVLILFLLSTHSNTET
jgi:hypothetical protein